jgi:hypothetical protein
MKPPQRRPEIHVVRRNQRWEVSTNGVTRRMIDWFCTKERAIEHAVERAHDLSTPVATVVVERADGTVEATFEERVEDAAE